MPRDPRYITLGQLHYRARDDATLIVIRRQRPAAVAAAATAAAACIALSSSIWMVTHRYNELDGGRAGGVAMLSAERVACRVPRNYSAAASARLVSPSAAAAAWRMRTQACRTAATGTHRRLFSYTICVYIFMPSNEPTVQ